MTHKHSTRPDVLIVADDVTGALDSAVAFATRGLHVVAALSPDHLLGAYASGADVVAVATNSRDIDTEAARASVSRIGERVRGFEGILFKKIDSRLKGHIATEIEALTTARRTTILASPAIPRLGRRVTGGKLCGAGVAAPIDVASQIGHAARIPDIASQDDLRSALPDDLAGTLFVGAAGLAEALAERLASGSPSRPVPAPYAPALFAIGSRDPVTVAQVTSLSGVPVVSAPNGQVPAVSLSETTVVQVTPGSAEVPGSEAGRAFAAGVANALSQSDFRTLLGCGGETAAAILRHLGAGLLEVCGELLPGVPLSRCLDTERPLDLITKSGGFGAPDTLANLIGILTNAAASDATRQERIVTESRG
ncbi:four-carbon acid sugar kinase family protein [Tropicimonas marinistellae]|uniref:four-carbon acid sugar kinase family protein n=1 Tax=Tropicimonas marinistellae TaxID=1739787 RepID=UPI0008309603|nr:four-carbon acid sugar kinase family protein [Tropicimonas marinistellae]